MSLQTLPSSPYNGVTIVFSNPSRFDKHHLLTGYIKDKFGALVYLPACDVRTLNVQEGWLPGTRTVLLLGQAALQEYHPLHEQAILLEQRGAPFKLPSPLDSQKDITYVATFPPQDSADFGNYEEKYNEELVNVTEDLDKEAGEKSTKAKTQRKNWWFWLSKDISKMLRIHTMGVRAYLSPDYIIYPSQCSIIEKLSTLKGEILFLDIETLESCDMSCFGFSFSSSSKIYVVPVNNYNGEHGYDPSILGEIFRALAIAMRDNIVVAHNAMFDLSVLADKYKLCWGRKIEDTMLMHHRIFPEVEKSLGHCISLYTDLPYHKGEGVFEPLSNKQQNSLWEYNGKDIYTLKILHGEIKAYAEIYGLQDSLEQVNSSISPYLTISHTGISYNKIKMLDIVDDCARRMLCVADVIEFLAGYYLNPNSPKQVSQYLYKDMGYKRPMKDITNSKNLYKLLTKIENPVITLILYYRELGKLCGTFKFTPWLPKTL